MKNNILFAAFALMICTTQNSWAQNGYGYGHHRDYDDAYRNNQAYSNCPNNAYNNGYNRTYHYSNNGYYNQGYYNNGNQGYYNNGYYTQNNACYNGQGYGYRHHYRRPCNYYPAAPVVVYQNRTGYCPPPPMMQRPRVNINIGF
jgi:hypothetical protein